MVRIKDIAKHAHVSSATVSRVLNKDKTLSVSDDTRQKVLQIAREFNYKTYQERRSENQPSSNQTSKKIGIIINMYLDAMELRKNAGIKGFLILNYCNFII